MVSTTVLLVVDTSSHFMLWVVFLISDTLTAVRNDTFFYSLTRALLLFSVFLSCSLCDTVCAIFLQIPLLERWWIQCRHLWPLLGSCLPLRRMVRFEEHLFPAYLDNFTYQFLHGLTIFSRNSVCSGLTDSPGNSLTVLLNRLHRLLASTLRAQLRLSARYLRGIFETLGYRPLLPLHSVLTCIRIFLKLSHK